MRSLQTLYARATTSYKKNPIVNVNVNATVISLLAGIVGAIVSWVLQYMHITATLIVLLGFVANQIAQFALPLWLHYASNAHVFRTPDNSIRSSYWGNLLRYYATTILTGGVYVLVGVVGHYVLVMRGWDAGFAALVSYGAALVACIPVRTFIGGRIGLFKGMSPTV